MQLNQEKQTLIKTAPQDSAAYFIDQDSMGHIGTILQGMYSDPLLAVIREYCANAVDAHVQVGKGDLPIEITLPTKMLPTFKVRDYGPGLSDAMVKKLLLGYGASGEHKRQSSEFIGGFGIGCKCALAVSEQFTYTIWHGGKKVIWNSYKDEFGASRADKIHEQDCSEDETGVEAGIPIEEDSVYPFQERAKKAFQYYRIQPKVLNAPAGWAMEKFEGTNTVPTAVDKVTISLAKTGTGNDDSAPVLVMGGVGYPVALDKVFDKGGELPVARSLLVITAPISYVQLSPSREALMYTPFTKKRLKEALAPYTPSACEAQLVSHLMTEKTWLGRQKLWCIVANDRYAPIPQPAITSIQKKLKPLDRQGLRIEEGDADGLERVRIWTVVNEKTWEQRNYISYIGHRSLAVFPKATAQGEEALLSGTTTTVLDLNNRLLVVHLKEGDVITKDTILWTLWNKYDLKAVEYARYNVVIIQGDWDVAVKNMPWLEEVESKNLITIDEVEVPSDTDVFLRSHIRAKQAASSGKTPYVRAALPKIAQHSVKLLKLNTTGDATERGSNAWDPVTIASGALKGKPVVVMDKFYPTKGHLELSLGKLREISRHDLFGAEGIYGIRERDSKDINKYGMVLWEEFVLSRVQAAWGKLTTSDQQLLAEVECPQTNGSYRSDYSATASDTIRTTTFVKEAEKLVGWTSSSSDHKENMSITMLDMLIYGWLPVAHKSGQHKRQPEYATVANLKAISEAKYEYRNLACDAAKKGRTDNQLVLFAITELLERTSEAQVRSKLTGVKTVGYGLPFLQVALKDMLQACPGLTTVMELVINAVGAYTKLSPAYKGSALSDRLARLVTQMQRPTKTSKKIVDEEAEEEKEEENKP